MNFNICKVLTVIVVVALLSGCGGSGVIVRGKVLLNGIHSISDLSRRARIINKESTDSHIKNRFQFSLEDDDSGVTRLIAKKENIRVKDTSQFKNIVVYFTIVSIKDSTKLIHLWAANQQKFNIKFFKVYKTWPESVDWKVHFKNKVPDVKGGYYLLGTVHYNHPSTNLFLTGSSVAPNLYTFASLDAPYEFSMFGALSKNNSQRFREMGLINLDEEREEARALVAQKEQAIKAGIEYERQQVTARKEQVIINKKAAYIKRSARNAGLEPLFKIAAESSKICRQLSNINSSISRVSCEYDVDRERTSKGCANLKSDIKRQLRKDKRSACDVSRKTKNQLYGLFGRKNERAVNVAINNYEAANRISKREVKRMYPYVKTNLKAIVDEERSYAQEKHDNRPYEVSGWASGASKALNKISKSMPSVEQSFKRINQQSREAVKRSIQKSKRSSYKSSYKPSKYKHVSAAQFKGKLASIDRKAKQKVKIDMHAENKSRCDGRGGKYNRSSMNCTVINNGRGNNKQSTSIKATGKNALAFCWESKRSNDTWRCSGPGQLIQTFEPLKRALKQVGCYENHNQLQDGLYLKNIKTSKAYTGKLFSCNKPLLSRQRDIRKKYSGIPVHLQ